MAATIKIKNSSTASAIPTASDLVQGELAVNVTDKRLFTENASGTVVELGTNPSTLTVTAGATIQGLTVGKGAGALSTNTAVGASALASDTTGDGQTMVGYQAGNSLTTGNNNTAVGRLALKTATTPDQNTAIGYASLYLTTTGQYNTAVGGGSLQNNTTASNNTAVGYQAGYSNTTSAYNTFVGAKAGYNTTGSSNAFFGDESGYSTTTGIQNTFIGQAAGYYVSTGSKNTIIGQYTGNQGGLDIRTASNYIVLSDGDGNPRIWNNSGETNFKGDVQTRLVNSTSGNGWVVYAYSDNTYRANYNGSGGDEFVLYTNGNYAFSGSNVSDARLKNSIADETSQLANILSLSPKTYKMNSVSNPYGENANGVTKHGLIAQEVLQVLPNLVTGNPDNPDEYLGVDYNGLTAVLVKAIQELKAEFDAYKEAHP